MLSKYALLSALLAAALAAGCAGEDLRPYAAMQDTEEARRLADLAVEGEVAETQLVRRIPINNAAAAILGESNIDCITKTRVTLKSTRVLKGPPEGGEGPVSFLFYSPCYDLDPMVVRGASLSPVLRQGDRLRVFLVQRGGEWWLIAHEKWYRKTPPQTATRGGRMALPGRPTYLEEPGEPAPGAEGQPPGQPSPPMPTPPMPMPGGYGPAPGPPSVPPPPPDIIVPPPPGTKYPGVERWWPPPPKQ